MMSTRAGASARSVKYRAGRAVERAVRLGSRAVAALALLGACTPLPPPARYAGELPPYREGGRFAVLGDTQRTSALEFWRESNDRERALVMQSLAEARPAFLVVTGDLVFDGSSPGQWADFDAAAAPVRAAGIPVFPAFGNHEYWGGAAVEPLLFTRFPHLSWRHWYALEYGPVRLVVLDSNVDELTARGWQQQLDWYAAALARFDADPAVRGVVVLLHHPPYTNSTVTGDEEHVARALVPPFVRAQKTLAMVSGHVHAYEHFRRGPKTFLVNGGGGGPRVTLATGDARRHPDDRYDAPSPRDFAYLLAEPKADGLEITVMGLPKDGDTWRKLEVFTLGW
ncbi:MAG: metallophosphoesterase [Myxococcales bacterium]|nr:metallophosphoesterase [Myxococcales bacterium]